MGMNLKIRRFTIHSTLNFVDVCILYTGFVKGIGKFTNQSLHWIFYLTKHGLWIVVTLNQNCKVISSSSINITIHKIHESNWGGRNRIYDLEIAISG
jgi:hypothetical protein